MTYFDNNAYANNTGNGAGKPSTNNTPACPDKHCDASSPSSETKYPHFSEVLRANTATGSPGTGHSPGHASGLMSDHAPEHAMQAPASPSGNVVSFNTPSVDGIHAAENTHAERVGTHDASDANAPVRAATQGPNTAGMSGSFLASTQAAMHSSMRGNSSHGDAVRSYKQAMEDWLVSTILAEAETRYDRIDVDKETGNIRMPTFYPVIRASMCAATADGGIFEYGARLILSQYPKIKVMPENFSLPLTDAARNLVDSNLDEKELNRIELQNREPSKKNFTPDLIVEAPGHETGYILDLKRNTNAYTFPQLQALRKKLKTVAAVAHDCLHKAGHRPGNRRYETHVVDCLAIPKRPRLVMPITGLDDLLGIDMFSRVMPRVSEGLEDLQDRLGDQIFIGKVVSNLSDAALEAAAHELISRNTTAQDADTDSEPDMEFMEPVWNTAPAP